MASSKVPMMNEALTIARLYWGYSQTELAKALGISQAMVSEIERGTKSVSMETLEKYSSVLGIRMSQLMFFAEEIDGDGPVRKGRLIVAKKALNLLDKLKPSERENVETSIS